MRFVTFIKIVIEKFNRIRKYIKSGEKQWAAGE